MIVDPLVGADTFFSHYGPFTRDDDAVCPLVGCGIFSGHRIRKSWCRDNEQFASYALIFESIPCTDTLSPYDRPKSWGKGDVEPLVDALIFEPIPYR